MTERREAEEALRRSEERYRVLFETIPQPVLVVELETLAVRAANAAASRQYGYPREELIHLTLADLLAPESSPPDPLMLLEHPRPAIAVHRRRDGSLFPVEVVTGRLDFGGRPAMLGIFTDVTERRRAEEALRASEGRFRALLEHGSDAVLLVARDGTILYRSPSATRILGYTPTERVGAGVMELIHPEDRPAAREALGRALHHPGEPVALEVRAVHEDRSVVTLECVLVNRLDEPAIRAVVVNYRDVTAARAAQEEQLRQARKVEAVGHLAGGVAHDFNNLLTAILGYADLLQRQFPDGERTRRTLEEIRKAAERAAGLTRQLLAFSPKQVLVPEPGQGSTFMAAPAGGTETVLLVEDEGAVRSLSRRVLETAGYRVLEATGGEEALEAARAYRGEIHLALCDIVMSGISGRATVERLEAERPGLKVLYASGYTHDTVVRRGVLAQGAAFLQKPFTPEALLLKVRQVLDSPGVSG